MASQSDFVKIFALSGKSSLGALITATWAEVPHTAVRPGEDFKTAINPSGAVPTLEIQGEFIPQSTAIFVTLGKLGKHLEILGKDLLDQAKVLSWSTFLSSDVHPAFRTIFFAHRYTSDQSEDSLAKTKAGGIELVKSQLQIVEDHLKGRAYLATDYKTVADAHLFPITGWALKVIPGGLDDFPNIKAFRERLSQDEGVKAAIETENML